MLIVTALHLTVAPLPDGLLAVFLVGGVLLILGLSVFLVGVDVGMVPFGHKIGAALTERRSLPLLLIATFAIGFAITIAEPDVQVLAEQVKSVIPDLQKPALLVMIAGGVGIFLVLAMLRVVFQLSLRALLTVCYLAVFCLCLAGDRNFIGVAFDSGGATTGPITVPFIMALGVGVASVVKTAGGGDNNFGFVGLASIGPIAAVTVMGIIHPMSVPAATDASVSELSTGIAGSFLGLLPHILKDTGLALLPILLIFLLGQATILKLPAEQVRRIVLGMVYCFIGLVVFLLGVNGGFTPTGKALGMSLGALADGWALIPAGALLGAVVVCAEPAVWVLTEQVEEVSGGYIKKRIMLAALSISVALAVALGMFRVVTGVGILWLLLPGYGLALLLTRFPWRIQGKTLWSSPWATNPGKWLPHSNPSLTAARKSSRGRRSCWKCRHFSPANSRCATGTGRVKQSAKQGETKWIPNTFLFAPS